MSKSSIKDNQRLLSPRRNSTTATDVDGLVEEQLKHFFSRFLNAIWQTPRSNRKRISTKATMKLNLYGR